jgi:hypothetical protein
MRCTVHPLQMMHIIFMTVIDGNVYIFFVETNWSNTLQQIGMKRSLALISQSIICYAVYQCEFINADRCIRY